MKLSTTSLTRVSHFLPGFPGRLIHAPMTPLAYVAMIPLSPRLLCRLMMLLLEGPVLSTLVPPVPSALRMLTDDK